MAIWKGLVSTLLRLTCCHKESTYANFLSKWRTVLSTVSRFCASLIALARTNTYATPFNDKTVPIAPMATPNTPIAAAGNVSFVRFFCVFRNIMIG